ncbi:hypothetical protein FHX15_001171 [Rhizobium sp. BK650]|nr:hypothetical protein [Rhizobium sp. BK650]
MGCDAKAAAGKDLSAELDLIWAKLWTILAGAEMGVGTSG